MRQKLTNLFTRLIGFIPVALPVGADEFNAYCTRLITAYALPDYTSYREAIATMIMHLKPTTDRVAPLYFARSIRKAMANEVAWNFLQEQKRARATAPVLTVATPPTEVAGEQSGAVSPSA